MAYEGMTPEGAAMALLEIIAKSEGKPMSLFGDERSPSRQWVLETYSECLQIAKGSYSTSKPTLAS